MLLRTAVFVSNKKLNDQLETVRSRTAAGAGSCLSALSDLSPMSTSIPSSSGEQEEEGEEGVLWEGGRRQVVAENLTLRSMGASAEPATADAAGEGDLLLVALEAAAARAADLAAPNLARRSLCSAMRSM